MVAVLTPFDILASRVAALCPRCELRQRTRPHPALDHGPIEHNNS
jgi:hypothetical protein